MKSKINCSQVLTIALLWSCAVLTQAEQKDEALAITCTKIGYGDNDTFDTLLQGLLNSKESRIAVLTTAPYEGSGRPIPNLDKRLQGWIFLWKDANAGKGQRMQLVDSLPQGIVNPGVSASPVVIPYIFDFSKLDPNRTVKVVTDTVERWAKEGAAAVTEFARSQLVQQERKSRLKDYYLYFASVDGRAVILLSREPLSIAQ